MDSPELTARFITLANINNSAIRLYYQYCILPVVKRHIRREDALLDLGCAGGVMLTLLKKKGFMNLSGIDAASVLLDLIPDKSIPTVCDNYLNVRTHYRRGQFDAAIVFNTLHHLDSKEQFYQFFDGLRYILKPGATVLIKELRNGWLYKAYNGIIKNRITNALFPSVFERRNFVQTEETGMHSRFFKDIEPCFNSIIEHGAKFKVLKRLKPLTFESIFVLKAL